MLWWGALLAGVLPICFRQVTTLDAWWHAALGKWLVENRALPDLARFYFTATDGQALASELRWTWLGDIILYAAYSGLGAAGLQFLSMACLVAALAFLARIPERSAGPWTILLLVAVTFGTYQLQLPRNAIFSLALYPAVLWLGLRKKAPPQLAEYALIGAVLVVWSCLHGSCILGWMTGALLFGGRALQAFREGARPGGRAALVWAAVFAVTLAVLAIGRTGAVGFLLLPVRHLSTLSVPAAGPAVGSVNSPPSAGEDTRPKGAWATSAKTWLNRSVWKPGPDEPSSTDFFSPFDLPKSRSVQAALALAIAAAACAAIFRAAPLGLVVAWCGAVFLGLGYIRMVGYAALASAALLLASTVAISPRPRWRPIFQVSGWMLVGAWTVFAWTTALSGRWDQSIMASQHVSRWGKVPVFDDRICDWVLTHYPGEKVFTTIDTGSYALLRWGFRKPVFVDGFFAPHQRSVWRDYLHSQETGDLSLIHDRYGATVALIPVTAEQWIHHFFHAPDWRPVAIGPGNVVFLHTSLSLAGQTPAMLLRPEDLRATSDLYKVHSIGAAFLILQHASKTRNGFSPGAWTAGNEKTFAEFNQFVNDFLKKH